MKSEPQGAVDSYAKPLSAGHAAICRLLQKEIDAALPSAASKIWHGSPVWFVGENPVVGYNATPKQVNLLFWSGQLFGDSGLKPAGKFKAAQIQFTEPSQIDAKTLRGWLRKSGEEIWDYQGHFKAQKALQKKAKT
jgi:hypothetical protein